MISSLKKSNNPPLPSPQSWQQIAAPNNHNWVCGPTGGSAYYHNGKTYIGFINLSGEIRVAQYNHSTGAVVVSPVLKTLAVDAHSTPTITVRQSDSKVLMAVAPHASGGNIYFAVSTNAEDVSAWGATTDISSSVGSVSSTYAYIMQLSGESGKLYIFYREATANPSALWFTTSTDGGSTWAARTKLYLNGTNLLYWSIDSDDSSRIDFIVGDGAVQEGDTASVYHFYYTGGNYYKSDGTLIGGSGSLPLGPSNLTKIYDGATNGSLFEPRQVISGPTVYAGWTAYDPAGTGQPPKYWYGSLSGGTWTVNQIDTSGAAITLGVGIGGFAIDPTTPTRVYVSKYVSNVWQVYTYTTSNGGTSWTSSQITTDATAEMNTGLVAPRHAAAGLTCVWLFGPTDYQAPGGTIDTAGGVIRSSPNFKSVF